MSAHRESNEVVSLISPLGLKAMLAQYEIASDWLCPFIPSFLVEWYSNRIMARVERKYQRMIRFQRELRRYQ